LVGCCSGGGLDGGGGGGGGELSSSITTSGLAVLVPGGLAMLVVFRTLEGSISVLDVVSKSKKKFFVIKLY